MSHVGLLWAAFEGHFGYSCITEYSLGFGYSCTSNIAHRFAFGILDTFRREFDTDDASFVAAERRRAPAYFATRDSLSSQTGRDESRLAVVHIYTANPIFVVVGAAHAVRVLRTWKRVTRSINLTMAAAAKHQGGVAAVWLGLLQLSQLGALAIPLPKHSAAIAEVRALLRDEIFQEDRYQSILGLLEHILVYANGDRGAIAFMHAPIKALQNAGPTAAVYVSNYIKRQLVAWEARLAERAGIPASAVFTRSEFSSRVNSALPGLEYVMSTNAAPAETTRPGIGGYCHGHRFRFPLDSSDVGGPFKSPVPVLEFTGITFGICAFVPGVGGVAACVTLGSDSITSVDTLLNISAHAALMQVVHGGLLRTIEYASVRHELRLGHIFGEGNVWADAESRGYDDAIAALSAQLGVSPTDASVPPHAVALINRVRTVIRNRPLTEDELRTSEAYSEGYTGDGPVSLAVFAGRVELPPYSMLPAPTPPAADPLVRLSLAVFVAPLAQPTVVLTVSSAALASNPGARLHVTARFAERSAKPYVSVDNALAQVVDVLARDTSSYALRARDPAWLAEMARDVAGYVQSSVPEGTLTKVTFAWRQWALHLEKFRSRAWRPDRNDLDSDGRARERFVFDSFFLEEYRRIVR